jgi:hypothetical protein
MAGIELGWVTFLTLEYTWISGAPYHYALPNHTGICEIHRRIFNQPCGNGTHCTCCTLLRCSSMKGRGSSLQRPSNSHDACFEIPYRLGPPQSWSNTIIQAGGNIRFISSYPTASAPWLLNIHSIQRSQPPNMDTGKGTIILS